MSSRENNLHLQDGRASEFWFSFARIGIGHKRGRRAQSRKMLSTPASATMAAALGRAEAGAADFVGMVWRNFAGLGGIDSVTFVNIDVPHDIASDQDGFWSAHISISVD